MTSASFGDDCINKVKNERLTFSALKTTRGVL